jgi:hypothetical protein
VPGPANYVAEGIVHHNSGKSGWLNALAERIVRAPDAMLCMIDLSPGAQELRDWAPACAWFASSVAEAERLFEWLAAVCDKRGEASSSRLLTPSAERPYIGVILDESATMFAPDLLPADAEQSDRNEARRVAQTRAAKVEYMARLARKYGIGLHFATQYGEIAAVGGPTTQQQLLSGYAAIFRCAKNQDAWRVASASKGIEAAEIPANKPGSLYIYGATVDGTASGRIRYMTDEAIRQAVARWKDHQPLPEPALRTEAWQARQTTAPGGQRQGDTQSPTLRLVKDEQPVARRPARMTPEESRTLVLDALRGFPDGATVEQLGDATGKSAELLRGRLRELESAGLAARRGRREPVWRAATTQQ